MKFFREFAIIIISIIAACIIWTFYQMVRFCAWCKNVFRRQSPKTTRTDAFNDTAARYRTAISTDDTRYSKTEIAVLLYKTHEALEGRYDLTVSDLVDIHFALCELQ